MPPRPYKRVYLSHPRDLTFKKTAALIFISKPPFDPYLLYLTAKYPLPNDGFFYMPSWQFIILIDNLYNYSCRFLNTKIEAITKITEHRIEIATAYESDDTSTIFANKDTLSEASNSGLYFCRFGTILQSIKTTITAPDISRAP